MAKPVVKRKKRQGLFQEGKLDSTFLIIVLILLTTGLVMLFSSSYAYSYEHFGTSYKFIVRQAAFAVGGVAIMLIFSKINYHVWQRLGIWIYIGIFFLLIALLILPPMAKEMGVKRWFVVGPINFQPSEIGKFALIVVLSHLISANQDKMKKFGFILFLGGVVLAIAIPIVAEPHISATILILAIAFILIYIGGMRGWIAGLGALGGLGGILLFLNAGFIGYSSDRIKYWHDPWLDAKGKGFQTIQSLLAIGSGGILGRGIGQSRQKYLWVPEPHNDFIFSIVCEELGLVGAVAIIIGFAFLVYRGFKIAMRAEDKFGMLLSIGLTFQVGLQAMLNIWVVTNTIPNTGISLPFFSYGGSSLVLLLAEMGIVLSVSRGANKDI
ncbi:MAG: putative lipid II flippase FtsW [Clostridia bacterium]|nr:putative lipid II flippase FtsW [Clostridia bacterium]